MSEPVKRVHATADALRQAFDRSFAQAPAAATGADAMVNLLAVTIGARPYAVRLADVSGLFTDKRVTWLPGPTAALRGIAGLRGTVLPVYDLAMLLGCPRAAAPRWLLVTAATPVGLACEGFDGHLSVRRDAIVPEARAEAAEWHVREMLPGEIGRSIIDLASVLAAIGNLSGRDRQT
jgi:purine-binding chemotaxis protein CheW